MKETLPGNFFIFGGEKLFLMLTRMIVYKIFVDFFFL